MVKKIVNNNSFLLISIYLLLVFKLVSCESNKENKVGSNEIDVLGAMQNDVKKDNAVSEPFWVEGSDQIGNIYKGKIYFKNENGAGYLWNDRIDKIYIDAKRSIDGGFEAIDSGGNHYDLLQTAINMKEIED